MANTKPGTVEKGAKAPKSTAAAKAAAAAAKAAAAGPGFAPMPKSLTPDLVARLLSRAVPASGTVTTYAPYNGLPLADIPQVSAEEIDTVFATARAAQTAWAAKSVKDRAKVFLKYHDLVKDNRETIMDLVQIENGKTRRDAFREVMDIMNTARYYARVAPDLLGPQGRTGVTPVLTAVKEIHIPKGVVSVISPWNFPFILSVCDTIPALIAGNAVVQKPDNQAALCALYGLDLALQAGLPEGLWQIALGRSSQIGTPLLDNANYLMFTGSTKTGRYLAAEAGKRLIASSMELGGKNPMLVLNDADIERTVEGSLRSCYGGAGQVCVSIERLYVQDKIYDEFVGALTERVRNLALGATYEFGMEMGSLTSQEQLEVISSHVDDAVSKGATVLAGAKARPDLGPLFYEPTLLEGVTDDMTLCRNETFGPVVSVYRFKTVDEGVALANDTEYGLAASVWGGTEVDEIAARIHAGIVTINEDYIAAWGSVDAPMGGLGDSGMGSRHGTYGLLKYTSSQTIARQRVLTLQPPGPMTHEQFETGIMMSLDLLKRVRWR
ncbi:MAG: succinate-semialdehyde dehydrogenase (NADP(+)) [Nocardiaceae bacterium]|nr:succinate-semialdehyde dehydrogenase (NADP(+)) [Nocardiaceae bacterium]